MSDECDNAETIAPVPVNLVNSDSRSEDCHMPDGDMMHIRVVGCDGYRQCEVSYLDGFFYLQERGVEGGHFLMIGLDSLFRRGFVSIIKANDGMGKEDALEHGMKELEGYLDVLESTKIDQGS